MVRAIAIKQVNGPLFMLNGGEMENEFVGAVGGMTIYIDLFD